MDLSIKETLRASWAAFKKNPWPFVGATAVIMVVSIITNTVDKNSYGVARFIIGVVGAVVTWWLYIGFLRMALSASSGGAVVFKDVFSGQWPMLLQFAIAAILTGIIVAVGLVLLIIPGLVAQTGLLFGALFVIDKGMKGWDSVKASWKLTKGHRWPIFWNFIVLAILNIVGVVLLGVGLLVTAPLTVLALVHLYRELEKGIQPVAVSQS